MGGQDQDTWQTVISITSLLNIETNSSRIDFKKFYTTRFISELQFFASHCIYKSVKMFSIKAWQAYS